MRKMLTPAFLASLLSFPTIAAPETHYVDVSADIPSNRWHFRPMQPINGPQEMKYNPLTKKLSGFTIDFLYEVPQYHRAAARLSYDAVLTSKSTSNTIPLKVRFGWTQLVAGENRVLVWHSETGSQKRAIQLTVEPTNPVIDNTIPDNVGAYTGSVEIVFDALHYTDPIN